MKEIRDFELRCQGSEYTSNETVIKYNSVSVSEVSKLLNLLNIQTHTFRVTVVVQEVQGLNRKRRNPKHGY